MPALSNFTISGGAAVAHTFTPVDRDKNGVVWFEQITPTPSNTLGAKKISYKQQRGLGTKDLKTAETRVSYTIHVPVLETLGVSDTGISPPPTVAYKETARIEFVIPERSTSVEREDLRALAVNLLNSGMAESNVDDLQVSF